jgi:hypothetical protein
MMSLFQSGGADYDVPGRRCQMAECHNVTMSQCHTEMSHAHTIDLTET